ncbi:2663_t:CDS:2 [Funneliformis geosporum]|uniref:2663_t:CDS:1 n=1 Tax=Funneliformis geosporum TaxID=1117311 RepID=A0A9W4SEF4_9GLOM|nr:2663_t:CDS:2 [Funneliformis geosporum]
MNGTKIDCLFCEIVSRKKTAYVVAENEGAVAILDIMPVSDGHVLLITKKHFANISEIEQESWGYLLPLMKDIIGKITIREQGGNEIAEISIDSGTSDNSNQRIRTDTLNGIYLEKNGENWEPEREIDLWSIVDWGTNETRLKNELRGFIDLLKRQERIERDRENFTIQQITNFQPDFERYQQPEKRELYELESFFGSLLPGNRQIVKRFVDHNLEKIEELKLWLATAIPNLSLEMVNQASLNEFDIRRDKDQINPQGLYKGFSIFRTDAEEPANNQGNTVYVSTKSRRSGLNGSYKVDPVEKSHTKTFFDLREAKSLEDFLEILTINPTAYQEIPGATKSEHLLQYQKAIDKTTGKLTF